MNICGRLEQIHLLGFLPRKNAKKYRIIGVKMPTINTSSRNLAQILCACPNLGGRMFISFNTYATPCQGPFKNQTRGPKMRHKKTKNCERPFFLSDTEINEGALGDC